MQLYTTNMNLCRLDALTHCLCAEQQKEQGKESKSDHASIIPFLYAAQLRGILFCDRTSEFTRRRELQFILPPSSLQFLLSPLASNNVLWGARPIKRAGVAGRRTAQS